MSTPIQQLPPGAAPPPTAKMDDDPAVHDVIHQMEMEFQNTQAQPPAKAAAPAPAPQQVAAPRMVVHTSLPSVPAASASWIDMEAAKRAAMVAVVALVLFYPDDIGFLYERVPMLGRFAQNDRLVRAVALAVVLYILFWKLDI